MTLIPPLSDPIHGAQYREALPEPTFELFGDQGINMAVGYPDHAIVYRGNWDQRANRGNWAFSYFIG